MLVVLRARAKYWVIGKEGKNTNTPHLQGYGEWKDTKNMSQCKAAISSRCHVEPRKGKGIQASDYCKKEGDWMEEGKMGRQGERTDLTKLRKDFTVDSSIGKAIERGANFGQIRYLEKVATFCEKKRDWVPTVYWFWGPSGTGKTRTARQMFPEAWWSGKNLNWWQGYDGHEAIIIDDFRGDFCKFHELLRLLDSTPYYIENKGGSRQLLAKSMVVTCPYRPEEVYSGKYVGEIYQLQRRITELWTFEEATQMLPKREKYVKGPGEVRAHLETIENPEVGGNTSPQPQEPLRGIDNRTTD